VCVGGGAVPYCRPLNVSRGQQMCEWARGKNKTGKKEIVEKKPQ